MRWISSIRHPFECLFRSQGQVAHVLLTRSPLVYPRRGLTVRLACVKHAASVRPEPGSNSPLKNYRIDCEQPVSVNIGLPDRSSSRINHSKESELVRSRSTLLPSRARGYCLFGIDFRHAVEFSSFGC